MLGANLFLKFFCLFNSPEAFWRKSGAVCTCGRLKLNGVCRGVIWGSTRLVQVLLPGAMLLPELRVVYKIGIGKGLQKGN